MKNTECTIYFTTKRGSTQTFRRGTTGWTQTTARGVVRPMTAEQFLSHLLPALAFGHVGVRVVPFTVPRWARKGPADWQPANPEQCPPPPTAAHSPKTRTPRRSKQRRKSA